jgi:phenylacetate-CoA ligase
MQKTTKLKTKKELIKALSVFHFAAQNVPAYQDFLKQNRINNKKIKKLNEFFTIPITNKKNYLEKYSFFDFLPNRKVFPLAYASSGSSGKPTFWLRGDKQERLGAKIHKIIFKNIFNLKKDEPSLMIICFSMGIWVAGGYTLSACNKIARDGYQLTTITPGIEKEDIFYIFKHLAPLFNKIILAGYPPFLMDIVVEISKRKIIPKKDIKIITAGDNFSEEWRATIASLLQIKKPEHSIIGIYGSADAGAMGHETPLSIFIRKTAIKNKNLRQALFGKEKNLPAFIQYNPNDIFFEENQKELIFTTETAIPLIRYNIHDIGNIFTHNQVKKILQEHKLESLAINYGLNQWRLPFIVKKGRTDVAVTFYAINIYPNNIKSGLENKKIAKLVSGKFFAFNKTTFQQKKQKLYIEIELAPRISPKKKILTLIKNSVVENLMKLNIEYRKLCSVLGKSAHPTLRLISFGQKDFQQQKFGGVLTLVGKKPRVLNLQN